MIDTTEQTTTECLACGSPIIQIAGRGHRKRLYCDDRCRQQAHRQRLASQDEANVTPNVTNGDLQQRIAELEQDLAEANEFIEKLVSKKTTTSLKKSYQERLQRWGEKLDWPALDIHIRVQPGRKAWRVFMINESNDQLIRAIIAAERVEE